MKNHIKRAVQASIRRAKGVDVQIDPDIKTSELIALAFRHALALTRGIVRWRAPVYLERGVIFRSRHLIEIGRFSKIGADTLIDGLSSKGIKIGSGVSIGRHCWIRATASLSELGRGIRLGDFVGIADYAILGCYGGIDIGPETIVGPRLAVHSDNHDFDEISVSIRCQKTTKMPVSIGARCWLGSNVTILGGVSIGDDCIVGAGSVVTRSFPSGSIIAGNPARKVRSRFGRSDTA